MYVHIGGEYSVSDKYVIGIFDFDGTTSAASDTIGFLRRAENDGRIETVSPELPRAFIVTMDRVYITPISAATLRHRLQGPAEGGRNWPPDSPDQEKRLPENESQAREEFERRRKKERS
jgi:extracellular matrix regulatory protein B